MLIDRYLPRYQFVERHQTLVDAPPQRVFQAVRAADLGRSVISRTLLLLRWLPGLLTGKTRRPRAPVINLETAQRGGFILLGEEPDREVLLGLVGQFWRARGQIQRLDPPGFLAFQQPGFAKTVMNFAVLPQPDGRTLLTTETRIWCLDEESRRKFRWYWAVIAPFSGLIRREMLRVIRQEAERME